MLFLLVAFWPVTHGINFIQKYTTLSATWIVSSLVMSIFTLLPAMKVESVPLM